jgi:hypothetical protein
LRKAGSTRNIFIRGDDMTLATDDALIEAIYQILRQYRHQFDDAILQSICEVLRGKSTSLHLNLAWYSRFVLVQAVADALFKKQPAKHALTPLDVRALDLLITLDSGAAETDPLFMVLVDSPLTSEVVATLLKRGVKATELLRMAFRSKAPFANQTGPTTLGRALLPLILEHPNEAVSIAGLMGSSQDARLRVIQLLLASQPPLLDLADQFAAFDLDDGGECAALLMRVDERRFIKHALRITEEGHSASDVACLDALQALMERDPQAYADRAAAAARRPVVRHNGQNYLQCYGLEAAFHADRQKYWPLVEESMRNPAGSIAACAARLAAQAPAEQSLIPLRECVAGASADVALVALGSLLQVGGLSEALQAFTHNSKQIRQKATEWLVNHKQEAAPAIGAYLDHRNTDVRLAAVDVLNALGDEPARALLQARLDKETSVPVKQAILDALSTIEMASGAGPTTLQDVTQAAALIEAEAQKLLSPTGKPPLPWPDVSAMPPLRWKNGAVVPPVVVTYLLYQQSRSKEAQLVPAVLRALRSIERGPAVPFAEMLYGDWLGRGAQAKEAWCLALAGALGDDRLAQALRGQVDEWAKHARGALAAKAVWALAAVGSDMALSAVYDIGRRIKHAQVREAAQQAFAAAAAQLGLSEDEMQDRIVPRLGFDEHAERTFDYGARRFTVRLGLDLSLSALDGAGRPVKALPAPAKSDAPDKAAHAFQEWKELRNQLKQAIKLQTAQLERALVDQRAWPAERWQQLFLHHPLLRAIAVHLVWAAQPGDIAFRPLEDGSLTGPTDEPVVLSPGAQVRLAHPLLLGEERRTGWLQHLADYSIRTPFVQLTRPVASPSAEEKDLQWWTHCEGYALNGSEFHNRYDKAGWQRGSVQDAGIFYTVWKAFQALRVEAILCFTGMPVNNVGEWELALEKVAFVPAGSVKRGSYVYDDLKEHDPRTMKLGDVPPVAFSEAVADVQSFMAAGQYDPQWRNIR